MTVAQSIDDAPTAQADGRTKCPTGASSDTGTGTGPVPTLGDLMRARGIGVVAAPESRAGRRASKDARQNMDRIMGRKRGRLR